MQFPKFPKMPKMSRTTQPADLAEQGGFNLTQGIRAGLTKIKSDPVLKRRVAMVGAAVVVVAGAGQFMEGSFGTKPVREIAPTAVADLMAVPQAVAQIAPVAAAEAPPMQAAEAVIVDGEAVAALAPAPQPQGLAEARSEGALLLPQDPEVAGLDMAGLSTEVTLGSELVVSDGSHGTVQCAAPSLALAEGKAGMIDVTFDAPCLGATMITVRQSGVSFKAETTPEGHYRVAMPALMDAPAVEIGMEDGEALTRTISLSKPLDGQRIAVSWGGVTEISLNAYEYGAAFGGAGHVRASAARAPETTLGGYMVRLGDESLMQPQIAEIYVAPAGLSDVRFDLEAQVSAATCNQDLTAAITRVRGGIAEPDEAVTLAMPDCEVLGGAIVMPLPEDDITLAMAQ